MSGAPPDLRWEHGDLWREMHHLINNRAPNCDVTFQKVKAHATQARIDAGLITAGEADANVRADTCAEEGRAKHGDWEQIWESHILRKADQVAILRSCVAVLEARTARPTQLQQAQDKGGAAGQGSRTG